MEDSREHIIERIVADLASELPAGAPEPPEYPEVLARLARDPEAFVIYSLARESVSAPDAFIVVVATVAPDLLTSSSEALLQGDARRSQFDTFIALLEASHSLAYQQRFKVLATNDIVALTEHWATMPKLLLSSWRLRSAGFEEIVAAVSDRVALDILVKVSEARTKVGRRSRLQQATAVARELRQKAAKGEGTAAAAQEKFCADLLDCIDDLT